MYRWDYVIIKEVKNVISTFDRICFNCTFVVLNLKPISIILVLNTEINFIKTGYQKSTKVMDISMVQSLVYCCLLFFFKLYYK